MEYKDFILMLSKENYNHDLAVEKGLINGYDSNCCYQIYNLYMRFFIQYLKSKIDFQNINEEFEKSNLFFELGKNKFLNVHIINFLFIEKLNIKDINVLKDYLDDGETDDSTVLKIVESTFVNVIKNNYINGNYVEDNVKIVMLNDSLNNYVDNDALVIRITYNGSTNLKDKKDFISLIRNRNKFLEAKKNILEEKIGSIHKTEIIYEEVFK